MSTQAYVPFALATLIFHLAQRGTLYEISENFVIKLHAVICIELFMQIPQNSISEKLSPSRRHVYYVVIGSEPGKSLEIYQIRQRHRRRNQRHRGGS